MRSRRGRVEVASRSRRGRAKDPPLRGVAARRGTSQGECRSECQIECQCTCYVPSRPFNHAVHKCLNAQSPSPRTFLKNLRRRVLQNYTRIEPCHAKAFRQTMVQRHIRDCAHWYCSVCTPKHQTMLYIADTSLTRRGHVADTSRTRRGHVADTSRTRRGTSRTRRGHVADTSRHVADTSRRVADTSPGRRGASRPRRRHLGMTMC